VNSHLIATGFVFNDPELQFDPNFPHTCCLICGAVYQTAVDRLSPNDSAFAKAGRKRWAEDHALDHSPKQHKELRESGCMCTPEAAQRLAAFGIISLTDLVLNVEVSDALSQPDVVLGNQEVIERWHITK
jgi:hypothetical protein